VGDYVTWPEVLKNVYAGIRQQAFPMSSIGQALGIGPNNYAALQQQQLSSLQLAMLQLQNMPIAIPKGEPVRTELILKSPQSPPHEYWLNERIGIVRARGRQWLNSGTIKHTTVVPTVVQGVSKKSAYPPEAKTNRDRAGGLPTKRTANGDLVYIYPEDHHVPQEVFDKWAAMNASRV